MSGRNLFVRFLLLTLAVISWFLVQSRQEEAEVYNPQDHRPDYWVQDLNTTEMDDPEHVRRLSCCVTDRDLA